MGPSTGKIAYTILKSCQHLHTSVFRFIEVLFFLFSFTSATLSLAQEPQENEEVSVFFYGRNIGGTELPAFIQGQVIYLPVTDVFSFLKIQNTPSPGFDSVTGFFINQHAVYLIERTNNRIYYEEKIFELKEGDLIKTENNLYLRSDYFGQVFGLDCYFNYRKFSVYLTTKLELPIIRELRQELLRTNISSLKGEMKTDTTISRNYPFFHFGTADWSVSATQNVHGRNNVLLNLTVGTLFAGGETTINLNYSSSQPFIARNQFWQWHYANNDHKVLKQIFVGKIPVHPTSSIYGPVIGGQVTNTPTTFRRSFCTYTITDYTQPGWIVELYVNYILVDYVKSDALGYFSFEVPLIYGNSLVKLRFYGPYGEEHSREQTIVIPFNFLPPKKLEYTISAGYVEDKLHSKYSRADFHYGVNRRLTVGTGFEYLSSIPSGKIMPFVNFSLVLASSLLVSGEYTYGVKLKGVMSYRLPSKLMFEFYYTKLNKTQTAIHNNFLEERKAIISMPIRIRRFSSLMRLSLNQTILSHSNNFSTELMFSGNFFGVSTNITTFAMFSDPVRPYIYSNLSLGFRLPAKIIVTPQVSYVFSEQRFLSFKIGLEKQLFQNCILSISYDRNLFINMNNFQIGIRYDLPFAQTNLSARYGYNNTTILGYAKGSLINEGKGGKFRATTFASVGKSGIIILPFLDLNGNGRRDQDEPKVAGLNIHITGGRIEKNSDDSTVRVSELEPYRKYYIEIDRNSFNNISWHLPMATIGITTNPNQYKLIEVPVTVVGEASGFVYLQEDSTKRGLGRITISIYRNDSCLVGRMLTESDGYFNFFGLSPGNYTARLDNAQLQDVRMASLNEVVPFTILGGKDGDVADGLEFVLWRIQGDKAVRNRSLEENTGPPVPEKKTIPAQEQKPVIVPEKQVPPLREPKTVPFAEKKEVSLQQEKTNPPANVQQPGNVLINADSSRYHIQVGAFRVQANAMTVQTKLSALLGRPVVIIQENGYYKLRITGFSRYTNASAFMQKIIRQGFYDAFIHKNR